MIKSRKALVLSIVAAAFGLGGLAYASIGGDTGGVIVACYQNGQRAAASRHLNRKGLQREQ
jgi:hypothetical protein